MCVDGNGGVRLPCGDQTPACRRFRFTPAKHETVVMVMVNGVMVWWTVVMVMLMLTYSGLNGQWSDLFLRMLAYVKLIVSI